MKIVSRSGSPVGQRGAKITMSLILGGAVWAGSASALSNDNVAPLGAQPQPVAAMRYSPGVQEVLKMVDAKVDADVLRAFIRNSPAAYSLSADDIISLKTKGVPDAVITDMIQHGAEVRNRAASLSQATPGANAPQYAPPPAGGYPASPPEYDYGAEDYGYPYAYPDYSAYPYYSFGYPYAYNYWWSSFGYPWYGYYSPFFYVDAFGYRHFRGFDHNRFGRYGGYDRFGRGRGFNAGRGFASPGRSQPWRPVGHFGGRSVAAGPFSPARGFAGRPSGGFAARSPSFAVRSSGFGGAGGFHSGGGFHGGGGFGGHGMGGHR